MSSALRRGDLVLESGRDEDVAVDAQDLGVGDVDRAGEALDRAVLLLPGDDLADVETRRRCGSRRSSPRHGDDGRALGGDERRGDRPGVAEALDRDASLS